MGSIPFDMIIKNVRLVNVLIEKIYTADIGIIDHEFAFVGECSPIHHAKKLIDGEGRFAVPGFIDSHMHIESSMMTPANFAAAVLPLGTTSIAADPHEIANVLGERGVQLLCDRSQGLPLHVHVMAPSTVPSAPGFEQSGAEIGAEEIARMLRYPGVLGLGEVMDFLGVIAGDSKMMSIIDTAKKAGVLLDGHVPTLRGHQLQAFAAAGIDCDHTLMDPAIVAEKLQYGICVQIQERFFTKELMSFLNQFPVQNRIMLVTDDVPISRLAEHGHVDALLRHAVALGLNPIKAVRYATINAADRLRLYHRGALAPGYAADLVLLGDLENFRASAVFSDGQLVAQNGRMLQVLTAEPFPEDTRHTMNVAPVSPLDFIIQANGTKAVANVIMQDGKTSRTKLKQVELSVNEGMLQQGGLMKMTVFERHSGMGGRTHALIGNMDGFRGALATTYAHDCHNLVVYSANDTDAAIAANELIRTEGGVVAVLDGRILASIQLPIAGILCDDDKETIATKFAHVDLAAKESLHLNHQETLTFITLMPLAVSPEVKLTDKGLIDVMHKTFLPLLVNAAGHDGQEVTP
jgi:adenine deaminase